MKNKFSSDATALFVAICYGQTKELTHAAKNNGMVKLKNDTDLETLKLLGINVELAEQFRLNLLKAIELEEKGERDQLRQGEFGGVSGGFYQGGNTGTGGTFGGGAGGGNQEEDGDEEDEEESGPTTPGPGAFGVLSGLFGIFSGLGTLNPSRIIQSTVNFFPPGQRMQAQMIVDSLIGYVPPENRTVRPMPSRSNTTPETVLVMTDGNSTIIEAKTNETLSNTLTSEIVDATAGEGGSKAMAVTTLPITVTITTEGPINVHKLLSETEATTQPLVHEDDEVDIEKRITTTTKPTNSTKPEYKVKIKVTAANAV